VIGILCTIAFHAVFGLLHGGAHASTVSTEAVEDTIVISSLPGDQRSWANGSLASRRVVTSDGEVDHEIWAIMKFELPDRVPGTRVESAVFRGTYTGISNQLTHELATLVSDDWQESTVTWNNIPAFATTGISPFRETNSTLAGQPFELAVTEVADEAYRDDGVLTLVMRPSPIPPIGAARIHQIAFGSSESAIAGYEPHLILEIAFVDRDVDGILDEEDNCPDDPNSDQENADQDEAGDACDPCPNDPGDDLDADGLCADVDLCADTELPDEPTVRLGVHRWASDMGGVFQTVAPWGRRSRTRFLYTLLDTQGCSCGQIVEALGLGEGHRRFGCSSGALQAWINLIQSSAPSSVREGGRGDLGGQQCNREGGCPGRR
jgi:hypothetical protein